MKKNTILLQFSLALLLFGNSLAQTLVSYEKSKSEWVYLKPDSKLNYKITPKGDRIIDFSYAGYMGGGVALPFVPVKHIVKPLKDIDNTISIQNAINEVAALPLVNGIRGAVLLAPGIFTCSNTIFISASGIVLRGSGTDSTTIKMVGDKHTAIFIGIGKESKPSLEDPDGQETIRKSYNSLVRTPITDLYVPSGANAFTVSDAKGFKVRDIIEIKHPVTGAWIHFMEMDNLKRDGKQQTWISQKRSSIEQRKITAISGNKITIDIPLSDCYDSKYLNPPGAEVTKLRSISKITQVGVESIHIQCSPLEIAYSQAPYSAIRLNGDDCWVKDISCEETMNSISLTGRRITVQQVIVKHTFPNLGASKPTDFNIQGSQILIDKCQVTGDNEYFAWTGSLQPGPNVILNSTFIGHSSRIQPHQRWSTGLLVDNCTVPNGGIDYMNRGVAGSGHGWTMGWAVVWNSIANNYIIQNPPGTFNWAIGCIGTRMQSARLFESLPILPEGIFESHGVPVTPQSLYLAQLLERLGSEAIKNIGYSSNSEREFINKSIQSQLELRLNEIGEFGKDHALYRPVNTRNSLRKTRLEFSGEKAVDGNDKTYWMPEVDSLPPVLEVDTEGAVEINVIEIHEAIESNSSIQEYKVEGQVDNDWKLLSHGTIIGKRKIDRFEKSLVWKVRLTILKSNQSPAIRKFGFFLEK